MSDKYNRVYKVRDSAPSGTLEAFSDLEKRLFWTRGIVDEKEAEKFLKPDYELHTHDPYLLKDMDKAVQRIKEAIKKGEKIAIYSDYDADGIPGAVVLHDFFKKIKYDNFLNYIPTRNGEGFGLNQDAIDYLEKEGVKLIITIDCGTSDWKEVELANQYGINVIITDHHLPPDLERLPQALAIVNPKQADCKYPEKMLCGAGVIFKVVQALVKKEGLGFPKGQEKWLLDMVGLATLSDMVPLLGENRVFASFGLLVLRKSPRPGLLKLFSFLKINKSRATEDDIAFMITPRINAASRIGIPLDAFKLLSTQDETEAALLVEHLNQKNDERKGIVGGMVKEIKKRIEAKNGEVRKVIVMGNPDWKPSLVGLVANSVSDEHDRPVFIWGRSDDGTIKGSCRSGGSVSVVELMDKLHDLFLERGGHDGAGGFSLLQENVYFLEQRLNQAFEELEKVSKSSLDKEYSVDGRLRVGEVNMELWKKISSFAPFGLANPKPVFLFQNILVSSVKMFGKEGGHLEARVSDPETGKEISAIYFFFEPSKFSCLLEAGKHINLVATIEKYEFGYRGGLRLRIVDFFSC